MIEKVSANQESFRAITFSSGFNLVLAERTEEASERDSRNGLGKSLLLEILHFCLGSRGTKGRGVRIEALEDWKFRVDLSVDDTRYAFSRAVADHTRIDLDTAAAIDVPADSDDDGRIRLRLKEQRLLLGRLMFGLTEEIENTQFGPSYRSLLSYLLRRGPDGFLEPFIHDRNQQPGDKQVNVAYHLGLNWADACRFEELRQEKKSITQLEKAVKEGGLPSYLGSEGALEAERVRLTQDVERRVEALGRFEVRDDYREIEVATTSLTETAHQLVNENIRDRRFIDLYSARLEEETEAAITGVEVEEIFEEANLQMPEQVHRRLEEVQVFHEAVVQNRQNYLQGEIDRLEREIGSRDQELAKLDQERTEFMRVLDSSGALEEYTRRQELLVEVRGRLQDVESRLARLREVTQARADWEERKVLLVNQTHARYAELQEERDRAIAYFNANTQALYDAPGRLIINVTDKGFEFGVDIERSDSHGVSNMKIFCFDLMLMQMWSHRGNGPGTLFHDSAIFDGVDERQIAAALELANAEAERLGFQYICTINSDDLPRAELGEESPVLQKIAIELHDHDPAGMLLGVEF
jgi:uncharacterized protein YydD (DUF2326 family)